MSKKCLIQVYIGTDTKPKDIEICEQQSFWSILDRVDSNYLLQFNSISDRKRFVKQYARNGRMLGKNYMIVKYYSCWKNDDGSYIPIVHISR